MVAETGASYFDGSSLVIPWYYVALTATFDGTDTTVKFYKNGGTETSATLTNFYVGDRRQFDSTNSRFWMGSARTNASDPETGMEGFIYVARIYQVVRTQSEINSHYESDGSQCIGGCSDHCPNRIDGVTIFLNHCLW